MRWHRLGLLLALSGCAAGPECSLIGCVSELTVRLPAGVTAGEACVEGVCAAEVVDGMLAVPLGRRGDGETAQVTVVLAGTTYEGEVPLTRSRPNGGSCPPVCVTGEAEVDETSGRVVAALDEGP